ARTGTASRNANIHAMRWLWRCFSSAAWAWIASASSGVGVFCFILLHRELGFGADAAIPGGVFLVGDDPAAVATQGTSRFSASDDSAPGARHRLLVLLHVYRPNNWSRATLRASIPAHWSALSADRCRCPQTRC